VSCLCNHTARLLLVAVGTGALAFGPGAGAAMSAPAPAPRSAKPAPSVIPLSNNPRVSYWAYPQVDAIVRATPSVHARAVGRLRFLTADGLGQAQVYTASRQERVPKTGVVWTDVSLPQRPNGITGWVQASALGPFHIVYGLLVIDRSRLRATLYDRSGHAIWSAPAGIGRPSLPTPAGHFYELEKLRAIGGVAYGPFALGTSAYSPMLSEWPGGGVVGIHGTDQPQLIPGHPSHGCIRLRNGDITTLWHLIQIGTRIEIR
jgi:L,D-transpeptidase-like protein